VESDGGAENLPVELQAGDVDVPEKRGGEASSAVTGTDKTDDNTKSSQVKRRRFFGRESKSSASSSTYSSKTHHTSDEEQDHLNVPKSPDREGDWDVGDDVKMGLG
jgi:hypothetical protein